jgi:hypothetical protein
VVEEEADVTRHSTPDTTWPNTPQHTSSTPTKDSTSTLSDSGLKADEDDAEVVTPWLVEEEADGDEAGSGEDGVIA